MNKGKLLIFSAPSGSGKTTIVKNLLATNANLGFSISACTRDKRGRKETQGQDYYFLSIDDFTQKIENQEFVEWEEVYPGGYYGTLKTEIERLWAEGKNIIFDVDVKGGLKLKEYFKEKALAIYVEVPSMDELERRLRTRGTETEDSISKRLYKVKFERTFKDKFDIVLVNDTLEESFKKAAYLYDEFTSKNSPIAALPHIL